MFIYTYDIYNEIISLLAIGLHIIFVINSGSILCWYVRNNKNPIYNHMVEHMLNLKLLILINLMIYFLCKIYQWSWLVQSVCDI